jgi:hypothetical protein
MALGSASISVGTTPTKLAEFDTSIFVQNGATDIFVGASNVTTTTGVKVVATTGTLQFRGKGTLYGVTSAGSSTVLVLSS